MNQNEKEEKEKEINWKEKENIELPKRGEVMQNKNERQIQTKKFTMKECM